MSSIIRGEYESAFICLLVLLISADCYVLCKNFGDACLDETTYAYMYTYKYPTEDVLEDGTPAYVESLKKEAYGYNLDVTVLGIDKDNPYFPVETRRSVTNWCFPMK